MSEPSIERIKETADKLLETAERFYRLTRGTTDRRQRAGLSSEVPAILSRPYAKNPFQARDRAVLVALAEVVVAGHFDPSQRKKEIPATVITLKSDRPADHRPSLSYHPVMRCTTAGRILLCADQPMQSLGGGKLNAIGFTLSMVDGFRWLLPA